MIEVNCCLKVENKYTESKHNLKQEQEKNNLTAEGMNFSKQTKLLQKLENFGTAKQQI